MTTELSLELLQRVIRELPGRGHSAARRAALASFAERGFPSIRDEDWKYTDLERAIGISHGWLMAGAPEEATNRALIDVAKASLDAHWLVIANGELQRDESAACSLEGIRFAEGTLPATDFTAPLSDLNAALCQNAYELTIGADYTDEKPIVLLVADQAAASPMMAQVRLAIRVAERANVRFVEYHVSAGEHGHYSNVLVDLDIAAGGNCRYVRLQDRALHHSQTTRLDARLNRDAQFDHVAVDIGGELNRSDLTVDLAGWRAEARLHGVYLAGLGQHIDNHIRVDHRVGPAMSRQEYRGVLAGRSRAVWNGKAIVHRGADGTDAHQANHNLLLSENAEIDAKPELEIYADDVKCAHGTTVGQLDDRALFYLRSRGIDEARAKRILTRAFAAVVVAALPTEDLRDLVGDKVESRLRAMAADSEQ